MDSASRILFLAACHVVFVGGILAQAAASQTAWTADAELLRELGASAEIEGFSINPPKGYSPLSTPGPDGSVLYAWAGDARADGSRAQLILLTFSPGDEVKQSDMEPALASLVDRLKVGKTDWKRGPVEHGTINGQPFVRTRWEGLETKYKKKIFGFNYLTIIGKKVIQISSQDLDVHQERALALAETSARTFKKK